MAPLLQTVIRRYNTPRVPPVNWANERLGSGSQPPTTATQVRFSMLPLIIRDDQFKRESCVGIYADGGSLIPDQLAELRTTPRHRTQQTIAHHLTQADSSTICGTSPPPADLGFIPV